MSAAPTTLLRDDGFDAESDAIDTTLLELVGALCEVTRDDREVVATVQHLLETGRVRLTGNFREHPAKAFR